ncbi:hypothetical protein FNV43_RR05010 [Rhamnella rubrinervis]|uniref:Uncharacterized protein n=1 Tax=Rhamnella rubrinervis TaxID=2594499 RepID=A0A8K0HKN6_9ROSA|nr:hypothetical protein FNV43_RR05010 [Rhamnella rubrinervis]
MAQIALVVPLLLSRSLVFPDEFKLLVRIDCLMIWEQEPDMAQTSLKPTEKTNHSFHIIKARDFETDIVSINWDIVSIERDKVANKLAKMGYELQEQEFTRSYQSISLERSRDMPVRSFLADAEYLPTRRSGLVNGGFPVVSPSMTPDIDLCLVQGGFPVVCFSTDDPRYRSLMQKQQGDSMLACRIQ